MSVKHNTLSFFFRIFFVNNALYKCCINRINKNKPHIIHDHIWPHRLLTVNSVQCCHTGGADVRGCYQSNT